MSDPLVTVIIPAYNRVDVLSEALDSVAQQTYDNLEVVVVDDESTEDVEGTVLDFRERSVFPVEYVRQPNGGPGAARSTGLQYANGSIIQYLDSDDLLHPVKIQRQVERLQEDPDAVMCYTSTIMVSKNDARQLRKFSDEPSDDLLATALQYRRWHTSSCLWRYKRSPEDLWPPLYNGEDVVHDVRVGVHDRKTVHVPEALTYAREVGDHAHSVPEDPQKFERFKADIVTVGTLNYDALKEHGLQQESKYTEPLAERLFHAGLLLAKLGDQERAAKLLRYVCDLSEQWLRIVEARVAISLVEVSRAQQPQLYRLLFRLHRRLVPPAVHVYRSV